MLAEVAIQRALFFRAEWDKRRETLRSGGHNGLTSTPPLPKSSSTPKLHSGGVPYGLVEFAWSTTRDPDEISRPSSAAAQDMVLSPTRRKLPGLMAISLNSTPLAQSQPSPWWEPEQDSLQRSRSAGQIGYVSDFFGKSPKRGDPFSTPTNAGVSLLRQNSGLRPATASGFFSSPSDASPTMLPDLQPWHQTLQDKQRARTPKQELLSPTRCITWRGRSAFLQSRPQQAVDEDGLESQNSQRSVYSFTLPDEPVGPDADRRLRKGTTVARLSYDGASLEDSQANNKAAPPEDRADGEDSPKEPRKRRTHASISKRLYTKQSTQNLLEYSKEEYQQRAEKIFHAMRLDPEETTHDQLVPFLTAMGHREINQEWMEDIIAKTCLGRQALDEEDVMIIATEYIAKFRQFLAEKTEESEQGAGRFRGYHKLLRSLTETKLFPGAASEFLSTVSDGRRNSLRQASVEDILNMRDMIVDNKGFTPADHSRITATFDRYDRDGDSKLDIREFSLALSWLGADVAFIRSAAKAHDPSARLTKDEFLLEMKKFYENEEERLIQSFNDLVEEQSKKSGQDLNGELAVEHLPILFRRLGCISATPEVVNEIMTSCNLTGKSRLLVEDALRIFVKWHEHQGFLAREFQEIDEAFNEFDIDGSGSMNAPELEVAIRWLGYPSTYQLVRDLVEEYDIDESGEVDRDEFTGFVARFRDNTMTDILRAFAFHDRDNSNTLDISELRTALLQLGYVPTPKQTAQLMLKGGGTGTQLNIWQFHQLVQDYRIETRNDLRQNQCFTDRELKQLKSKFAQYDPKHLGYIGNANLAKLIAELFPNASKKVESHRKAKEMLAQSDENGDGMITWEEFLHMMRLFRYHLRHEELHKEREAMDNITLSNEEVKDLRKIFEMFDADSSGDLTLDEVHVMLSNVLHLNESVAAELMTKIKEVDTDGNRVLDFAEFLFFMQGLFKENWKNIRNVSKAQADRAAKESQELKRTSSKEQPVERHEESQELEGQ